jgi:hypothetical protein
MRHLKDVPLNEDTVDLFISSDVWSDAVENREAFIAENRDEYVGNQEEWILDFDERLLSSVLTQERRTFIDLYRQVKSCKKTVAVLAAHGIEYESGWYYMDGDRRCSVQGWIDKHEGDYAILVLSVCNVSQFTPRTLESMLLLPDVSFGSHDARDGFVSFSMIHPQVGDMEYIIEYETNLLQQQIKVSV